MTDIKIKHVTDQEQIFDIFHWFPKYAFGPTPPIPDKEDKIEEIKQRLDVIYYVLFEDGKPASTAASTPMTQNVRGKIFTMGGLYNVVTHPEFRRKSYSKMLLKELLKADKDRGKIFASLYPFRESFYENLGYVSFQEPLKINFKTAALQPLLSKDLPGSVKLMPLIDNYQMFLDYMQVIQNDRHGMGFFDHHPIIDIKKQPNWLVVAMLDGETVGMMTYRTTGGQPTQLKINSTRFLYTKSEGRYLLLEWIARHIDQATEAEIWLPTYEEPNTWLSDLSLDISKVWVPAMGRILAISKISGMQVGPGGFTAKITDSFCPWNEGIWKFENVGGLLKVTPAEDPDCELSIQGISTLVYGTHHPEIFKIRGWGDPTEETQKKMLALFPPKIPYMFEYF